MTRLPQLLFGRGPYAPVNKILEEIPYEKVGERPHDLPHSIFEELWHLDFWQDYLLTLARGEQPRRPEGESGDWPPSAAPERAEEWSELLQRITRCLDEAAGIAADADAMDRKIREDLTVRDVLEDLLAHNSYHLGKVVSLRQLLGDWPPSDSDA